MSHGSLESDAPNACAVPWKLAWTPDGRPICRVAASTTLTASPSAASGARLKESVVAGNCPWWVTASGVGVAETLAMLGSGTSAPFAPRT